MKNFKDAPLTAQFPKYTKGDIIISVNPEKDSGVNHWFWKGKKLEVTDYRYGKIWDSDTPEWIYKMDNFFELRESQIEKCFNLYKPKL